MIISASYKTDIPAFYGDWFIKRLEDGYCKTVNAYNQRVRTVSLARGAVDGFVFWTKNVAPFRSHLQNVHDRGFPFVLQYTINAYPRELERSVVDFEQSTKHVHWLSDTFSPKATVWRYDPIVFTSLTPLEYHVRSFKRIAEALEGSTDEVVISFAQIYKKAKINLDRSARRFGFTWGDPSSDLKRSLAVQLSEVSEEHGMTLSICSQRQLAGSTVKEAECVSSDRLSAVAGTKVAGIKRGNRPDCACDAACDIGEYDTCPHGCVYCYAVRNRDLARSRYKLHDPNSPFLFEPEQPFADPRLSTNPFQIVMFD